MKQVKLTLLFLVINFSGLALGSSLMEQGPQTTWYNNLNKAPWTPPGWVFGFAWTTIMICFSIYLSKLFLSSKKVKFHTLIFVIAFLLNVSWNFIFFNQKQITLALICIFLLTILLFYYYFKISESTQKYKYLLLPYIIWLCIATSLNFYILAYN